MSVARKHHYIPQFYLAGFTPEGEKGSQLYQLDLEQRKRWKTNTENAGAERDFNRVDLPGEPIDAVEKGLAPFEEKVSRVLKKMRASKELPEDSEFSLVLDFVALLLARNKLVRHAMGEMQEKALWLLLQQMLASPERWDEQTEALREQRYPLLPNLSLEEARELFEDGGFEYEPPTGNHVFTELGAWPELSALLQKRNWSLLVTTPDTGLFISSDRPVSCCWRSNMPPGMPPPGIGEEDSEITAPLSKQLAICGQFDEVPAATEATREMVGTVNTRTMLSAYRFAYSPEEDFLCWGGDGKLINAADVLFDQLKSDTDSPGTFLVFFTDEGKYSLRVTSYQRDNSHPVKPVIRFWTEDLEMLRTVVDCSAVQAVHFIGKGKQGGFTRNLNLRFDSVGLDPEEPTVIKSDL